MASKRCRMCAEVKDLADFPNRSDSRDGKRTECKRCLVNRTSGRDRRDYNRAYRKANADRLREYDQSRPPRSDAAEYFAGYRSSNREAVLANERRYRQRNRHKEAARRHARRALDPLTPEDLAYVEIIQQDPCVYCGGIGGTVEHIRPVSSGGGNSWENFAGACLGCNSSKNNRELLQFLLSRC